jgi:ribosomal protein S18 acetylase RimI-like enzyme
LVRLRAPVDDADRASISDLVGACSPLTPHRIDLPWRLSSLGSPALAADARLCEDEQGGALALAAWQAPWAVLDLHVRPGPHEREAADALLGWAETRFREMDRQRGEPLPYWIEARADHRERMALLERHGYALDDDLAHVTLSRRVSDPLVSRAEPAGIAIRALRQADVEAYVALHRAAFDSTSMTVDWRARTLRWPGRAADLDLVAVDPDGALTGFCVCWLDPDGREAQIEPIGVRPDLQGRGLARALLRACFGRLQGRGVVEVRVETERTRLPALRAYEAAGFRRTSTTIRRGRWLAS